MDSSKPQNVFFCQDCGFGFLGADECPDCRAVPSGDESRVFVPWVRVGNEWMQERIDGSVWVASTNGPVPTDSAVGQTSDWTCQSGNHAYVGSDGSVCPVCDTSASKEAVLAASRKGRSGGWYVLAVLLGVAVIVVLAATLGQNSSSSTSAGTVETTVVAEETTTTTSAATVATTTLPPDITAFLRLVDAYANDATTINADINAANTAWENEGASYADTLAASEASRVDAQTLADNVAATNPPNVYAVVWPDAVAAAAALPGGVEAVIAGLRAPDDGTARREAVAVYDVLTDGFVAALDAVATTSASLSPATTIATTGETLAPMDAQIRDFLIVVGDLEENGRYVQAADGESWYRWTNEYSGLATEYLALAEQWDREYLAYAGSVKPGFGQMVSHALLRRSDGYRLVWEASQPEAVDRDVDSMLWTDGAAALDEASIMFADVWSRSPADWSRDAGTPGSALEDVVGADLERPDPIPPGQLVVGDCYLNPGSESVSTVTRAECRPGVRQIYWIEDIGLNLEGFPGEEQVQDVAGDLCLLRLGERFSVYSEDSEGIWYWYPDADDWLRGNTEVMCERER